MPGGQYGGFIADVNNGEFENESLFLRIGDGACVVTAVDHPKPATIDEAQSCEQLCEVGESRAGFGPEPVTLKGREL